MTFMSTSQLESTLTNKSTKAITLLVALVTLSMLGLFSSSTALANTCSKSDIDYYLQRGFTNAQVVQLCAGAVNNQNTNQRTLVTKTLNPALELQPSQNNQTREDESYLSAALDANSVNMTNQSLTILPRECIQYGPSSGGQASADLLETICVNTKLDISFTGMNVVKAARGLFLVKDARVTVKGNIKREFIGLNDLRRQDRQAILEVLKTDPKQVDLKVRRGIDPKAVASRLSKYSK